MAKRLRRSLKFLHELGSVGLMGAAATQLILSHRAEGLPPAEYAVMRDGVLAVSEWLLMPSLVICLMSGLGAMAAHSPFTRAGWALSKLATTVLMLEGTLVAVQGPAQHAAKLAHEIAAGDPTKASALADTLRHERGGLWVILILCAANIALAVWRPRFRKKRAEAAVEDSEAPSEAKDEHARP